MTTYTVYSPASGTVYGENLTVEQAAEIILTHDGHEYEVCPANAGGFGLLISLGSRNSQRGLGRMVPAWRHGRLINSAKADEAEAWRDIALQVVTAGWEGFPQAMTTEDYNAMMAEAAATRKEKIS